ncbi:acyl-CoA thioesterase [Aquabacterium sp.]|uniref:acyl-CoA thioesterase n=1 Tax=Aquabacterium sp. TaxID=1872578 RepID=UPI003D6CB6C8
MNTTESWDHPRPHILRVTVEEKHIDLMRHTNNVNYLQWLENVAWDHSEKLGLSPVQYEACGHGLVVRQHELNYLAPTLLGDELLLGTWITLVDKLSLYRAFQYVRASDGKTVFRARTHYVCVDIAQGRVKRMPLEFSTVYSAAAVAAA